MSKQAIPKGYKQTKVGVLPEEWEVVKLGETINFLDHKRKPIKSSDRQKIQGIYPYYGASGIIDYVNDYLFDEELILLGEDGANIIDRSSRLVFLANGKYWVNNHAHVLKAKNMMNNYFLCEYLESLNYEKYNTGTAQPKLNKDIVSKILICQPPLKEQQKIAKILSTWDNAIEKQEPLIVAKETLKKGLMQRLLSGDWDDVQLGNKFDFIKTYSHSRKDLFDDGDIEYLHYGDIHTKYKYYLDFDKCTLPKISLKKFKANIEYVVNGDLLVADASEDYKDIGKSVEVMNLGNRKVVSGLHTFLLRDNNNNFVNGYKCFIFSNHKVSKEIKKIATGISVLGISKTNLSKLKIPYPSKQEQQKIAQILSTADKEIELLKNELEALKEQKRGLMQRLLTGEVRCV